MSNYHHNVNQDWSSQKWLRMGHCKATKKLIDLKSIKFNLKLIRLNLKLIRLNLNLLLNCK